MGSSKFVAYRSTALLTLAVAVGAGVPFRDEAGHEYAPCPGAKKPGRSHRNGTFTRTGAVPRSRNAFIQRKRAEAAAALKEVSRGS